MIFFFRLLFHTPVYSCLTYHQHPSISRRRAHTAPRHSLPPGTHCARHSLHQSHTTPVTHYPRHTLPRHTRSQAHTEPRHTLPQAHTATCTHCPMPSLSSSTSYNLIKSETKATGLLCDFFSTSDGGRGSCRLRLFKLKCYWQTDQIS